MNVDAVASGAEAVPDRKVNLGVHELLIVGVSEVVIGACNTSGEVLAKFGLLEPAKVIEACAAILAAYGKAVIDQAAHPPLVTVPNLQVEGMPEIPSAGQSLGFRAQRTMKALKLLHQAATTLRGEG